MTTTRRSLLKSLFAMLCGLVSFRGDAKRAVSELWSPDAVRYSPPQSFLVVCDSAVDACNDSAIPKIGSQFPLIGKHGEPTHLTCVTKHIEPVLETRMGMPTRWLVTCEWKILPNSGLTTAVDVA